MKNLSQLRRVLALRSVILPGRRIGVPQMKTKHRTSLRVPKPAWHTNERVPDGFMQVVLNGAPVQLSSPADQVEVFLPNGTRLVVTGEKSMGIISSILKSR
jgi:hypothetical protein